MHNNKVWHNEHVPNLVEDVEQPIVNNGMEVLYAAAVEGIGGAMVPGQGLEPCLKLITVPHFKHVLGDLRETVTV